MNGYPVGTKCVITYTKDTTNTGRRTTGASAGIRIGDIVTVGMRMIPEEPGLPEAQEIDRKSHGYTVAHPVSWMRPIDADTGEDDQEVITHYSMTDLRKFTERA
jgi:hypothetical protein